MKFWGNVSKESIDALIEEVRRRPVLWNPKHAMYHHRALINAQWDEVAEKLKAPAAMLKTKWKGLRDNFRKEVKKLIQRKQTESVWIHMKQLNFLWNVLDTSQLECTDAMLQHLRTANRALNLSEEDKFLIDNVSKIEDPQYFESIEVVEDSLDFHDVIFRNGLGDDSENNSGAQDLMDEEGDDDEDFSDPDIMEVEAEPNDLVVIDDDDEALELAPQPSASRLYPTPPPLQLAQPSPPPLRIISTHSFAPMKSSSKPVTDNNQHQPVQKRKEDSDEHFIKSLLPFLSHVPSESKKRVRSEIQRIVMSACMQAIKKRKLDQANWQKPDSTASSTKTYMKNVASPSLKTISTTFSKPESDQEEEKEDEESVNEDNDKDINIYLDKPIVHLELANRLLDKMYNSKDGDSSGANEQKSELSETEVKAETDERPSTLKIKQETNSEKTEDPQVDTPSSTVADETLIKLEPLVEID